MKRRLLVVACLTTLSVILTSCTPAVAPTPKPVVPTPKAAAPTPGAPTSVSKGSEAPRYGGILPVHVNGPTPSFDIHQESTAYVIQPVACAYNSLVKFDPLQPTEIIGDLAQRWEVSEAGNVYTFYLHKGVKWHDGQPFTAEDVKFSLDRIRKPPRGTVSPRQLTVSAIRDIEAVDKDTIKITLNYPYAGLLVMLSTGWEVIMPKHVIESKGA